MCVRGGGILHYSVQLRPGHSDFTVLELANFRLNMS